MKNISGYFKCPNCGSTIFFRDDDEQITCSYCGSMLVREKNEYEKSLEFFRKRAIAESAESEKVPVHLISGQKILALITGLCIIVGIICHFLRI